MLNREFRRELMQKFARSPEDDSLLARLLDKADIWQRDGRTQFTRFLSERDKLCCTPVLRAIGADDAFFWGGYPEADRTLLILPSEWEDKESLCSASSGPIAVIRATWKSGETLSHRDFLGALMGLGIERELIGDILPKEGRCDILVLREIVPYLMQNLASAGRATLTLAEADEPETGEARYRLIKDTVASLRLDAVVGSGFSLARENAAAAIRSGKVSLDGLECLKPDKPVEAGSKISLRGLGKIVLTEASGQSRKGRTIVVIKRYI